MSETSCSKKSKCNKKRNRHLAKPCNKNEEPDITDNECSFAKKHTLKMVFKDRFNRNHEEVDKSIEVADNEGVTYLSELSDNVLNADPMSNSELSSSSDSVFARCDPKAPSSSVAENLKELSSDDSNNNLHVRFSDESQTDDDLTSGALNMRGDSKKRDAASADDGEATKGRCVKIDDSFLINGEVEIAAKPKEHSRMDRLKLGFMSPFLKRKPKKDKDKGNMKRADSRSSLYSLNEDKITTDGEPFDVKEKHVSTDNLSAKIRSHLTPLLRRKSERKSKVNSLHRSNSRLSLYSLSENQDGVDNGALYGSNTDVASEKLTRTPSFFRRKFSKIMKSTPNLQTVPAQVSFKDEEVEPEQRYPRVRPYDIRNSVCSLQSLAEDSVMGGSYTDFSEVCEFGHQKDPVYTYDEFGGRMLKRTQSLSMSSGVGRRCGVSHGPALARHYQSNLDIPSHSVADSSLQGLRYLHERPLTPGIKFDSTVLPVQLRRRFPSSVHDETEGDFLRGEPSTTSGSSKLARDNGCAKYRRPDANDATVRSRSLTHLDNLDPNLLKQSNGSGGSESDVLKDSRSEPDCTLSSSMLSADYLLVPSGDSASTHSSNSQTGAASRRHMMSRSQVSSSEYFSVSFEVGDDTGSFGREEFLPATKGTSLADALSGVCERRGIDIGNCEVFLDTYKNPIPIHTTETSWLGGKHLKVTAKDATNKKPLSHQTVHSRKTSGSYRSKTGKFFSASTEDPSTSPNTGLPLLQDGRLAFPDTDQLKKKEKQRWSGFFSNNKDTKMESLVEYLNNYSKHGVPNFETDTDVKTESTEALFNLETDWRKLVDSTKMTEKQRQQQTALWELITTEVDYIKMLKVVTNLFLACLQSLQSSNILNEIDKTKLFSNITDIHSTNLSFWRLHIYPMLRHTRASGEPLNPEFLLPGFVKFHEIFEPYTKYCSDQSKCQFYCRDMHSQNELFTAYLAWCETQKECNRLRLMDILVRPMQRLTKYGLLLKVIFKNSELEGHKECLSTMIKSVDDFVNSVNSTLKYKQDSESLRRVISRIESYDVVESKDDDLEKVVRSNSSLDLTQPMIGCNPERKRHLLLEDDFKLKDNISSKVEVHCILLTDLLLICKPSAKKGSNGVRVIRQPFIVDRLIMAELPRDPSSLGLVYLNEFNMAVAAFTLQGDTKKLKNWVDYIRKAQGLYRQAKQATLSVVRQQSINEPVEPVDFSLELGPDDTHSLLGLSLLPRSPIANSSRASRVSSLAHSHSGSVEMNDQSSLGSVNNQSRAISVETDQRTASISSDEGVQSLPVETPLKSPNVPKQVIKHRINATTHPKKITTPNTLSVQPYCNLGQSLPNLVLGSPNTGTLNLISPNLHTLSVPNAKHNQHLLSPTHRGISYPPPSPTRGNLRRGFAITQNKNPPLLKTRHINSTTGTSTTNVGPMSVDFDVPVIAGVSPPDELSDSFNRGQHRQAIMKRLCRSDNRRYHTAGIVDDIKKNDARDASIQKRLSWNCGTLDRPESTNEDQ